MQQRLVAQLIWPLQWMVSEGTRRVLVVWVGLIVAVIILTVAGLVWSPIAGFATRAALGIAGVVALCLIALVAKCLAVRAADEQAEHPEKSREAEIALVGVVVAGAVAIFVVPGPSVLGTTMLGATLLLILATYSRGVDLGLLPGLALGAAWGFGIIIMFGLLLDPWLKPDHLSHSQQLSAVIVPATPLTPSPRITGTVNFPEPGWEDYPAPAATEPPNALRHGKPENASPTLLNLDKPALSQVNAEEFTLRAVDVVEVGFWALMTLAFGLSWNWFGSKEKAAQEAKPKNST